MFAIRSLSTAALKVFLLVVLCVVGAGAYAASELEARVAEEQNSVAEAQTAKDEAQKKLDALNAQQAVKPNQDTERKIKDAEVELMMSNSKLSSANKSLERAQKKLDESGEAKPAAKVEKVESEPKAPVVSVDTKKIAEEQARKEAEVKMAAQKASEEAAKRVAEEQARKEAEAKLAAQKVAEDAAKKVAEEAAAKKQALAAELGIDLSKCIALPNAPTKPATELNPAEQAYAQGFLKQVNQIVAKKAADDVPPISPFPVLEGSKLSPCDPGQKQALKFGYMGNGQYRLETPVLAGEQIFTIKNVVQSYNRTIPESDNGEVYVFFLDGREGRTQLSAFKKSLLEPAPQ